MKTLKNIYLFLTGRKSSKYMGFLSQRLLWISSALFLAGLTLMTAMLVMDWFDAKITLKDYLIVGPMFIGPPVLIIGFVVLPMVLRITLAWLFPKSSGLGLLQWQKTSESDETIWWIAIIIVGSILYVWLSATPLLLALVISYVGGVLLLVIFLFHNAKPAQPAKT